MLPEHLNRLMELDDMSINGFLLFARVMKWLDDHKVDTALKKCLWGSGKTLFCSYVVVFLYQDSMRFT